MSICANYTVFYGEDYIKDSILSIYNRVDKINVALGHRSWKNGSGETFLPIDNVYDAIMSVDDPRKKIEISIGVWDCDTDQRNFLLDKSRGNYDYAMIIDADEVWEDEKLNKLLGFVAANPEESIFRVGIKHYFRSLYYSHHPIKQRVNCIYKINRKIKHEWIRHVADTPTCDAPLEIYYHHYGWAQTPYITRQKIAMWGHSDDVDPVWFNDVFLKWRPGGDIVARSPLKIDIDTSWTPMVWEEPIKQMRDHKFAGKELII